MLPVKDSRRAPRLRVRAPAIVAHGTRRYAVVTDDLAAGGCQFVVPSPLRRGDALWVTLTLPADAGPLATTATVAWASREPPWRAGVEFARPGLAERERRVADLLDADPALAAPASALHPLTRLRLGTAPSPRTPLASDERLVLRALREGATMLAVMARAGTRYREVRRAISTLLARRLVREGPPRLVDPGWALVLDGAAPVETAGDAAAGGAGPGAATAGGLASASGAADAVAVAVAPVRPRPLRVEALLHAARTESAQGHTAAAIEWLQAALLENPADREILAAIDSLVAAPPV